MRLAALPLVMALAWCDVPPASADACGHMDTPLQICPECIESALCVCMGGTCSVSAYWECNTRYTINPNGVNTVKFSHITWCMLSRPCAPEGGASTCIPVVRPCLTGHATLHGKMVEYMDSPVPCEYKGGGGST